MKDKQKTRIVVSKMKYLRKVLGKTGGKVQEYVIIQQDLGLMLVFGGIKWSWWKDT